MLNEAGQWAVLLLLGGTVLGLYRQLGAFIVPRREQLALTGPAVGDRLAVDLLGEEVFSRLQAEIEQHETQRGLIAVITEGCPGCAELMQQVRDLPPELADVPFAFVLASGNEEFRSVVPADDFHVVPDPNHARTHGAGITAWPFLLSVDEQMVVRVSEISSDVIAVVESVAALKSKLEMAEVVNNAAHS
jgi:hypothetical protein